MKSINTPFNERGSIQHILILFVVALAIVAMAMAVFGYRIGHKQGLRTAASAITESVGDEQTVNAVQVASLKQQLESAVQERDISLSNIETLRAQMEDVRTKNLQLEQFNNLLLDSVAREGGIPVKVLASEIGSLPERTYEYRFDVALIDKSGNAVTVVPTLTLLNNTSMVKIPLKPSSYSIQGIARIRGRFVMPKGFEPKQIKLELNAGGERVEQLYNWRVGKPIAITEDKGINERPIGSK